MEIFVPGRLCVLGEHSDWAAEYCTSNSSLPHGYVIVAALNEGLYATIKTIPNSSIFKYSTTSIKDPNKQVFEINFKKNNNNNYKSILEKIASSADDYFSYCAGVLLELLSLEEYSSTILTSNIGIEIINHTTTLPICRGLSSSAALCCLIVKSFSMIYFNNNLTMYNIMNVAYNGEMRTLSKCGRMDQCCAMGKGKIALMEFHDNDVKLTTLFNKNQLYFVVADLNAGKDTVLILKSLHQAFTINNNNDIEGSSEMFNYVINNKSRCEIVINSIATGNLYSLAECMKIGQNEFDKAGYLLCPSELKSPKLHSIINDQELNKYALAIKGVGSQGDGSCQVLCVNELMQEQVYRRLIELNCNPFKLTVPATTTDNDDD